MSLPESIRILLEEVAEAKGFFATTAGVIRWDEPELVIEIGIRAITLPNEGELVTLRLWQEPRGSTGEPDAGLWLTAEIEGAALGISLTAWLPEAYTRTGRDSAMRIMRSKK